ncbi:hypothetical protein GCM10023149_04270 [Mucilaginibacter gynuensis]|uniref:Macro domain-containing protein n=1 Tax=Mucilaginibacter gynuensis TaxID=1302236 RepID=A0ABP8FS32_9SPHI
MAITFIKGNLFNSKAQTIVNTVNCVGVMGKGIALVFKLRYPQLFAAYQKACKSGDIQIGYPWLYKDQPGIPWVLNFPTKDHWKYPSKPEFIEKGLKAFVTNYEEQGITSIAFPMLGTHNGGLDTELVKNMMISFLGSCPIPVEVYEFDPNQPDDLFERFKAQWLSLSPTIIKSHTGIRNQAQIDAVYRALNSGPIQSLIGLIEARGVGMVTMEKCFRFVMDYRQNTLFD